MTRPVPVAAAKLPRRHPQRIKVKDRTQFAELLRLAASQRELWWRSVREANALGDELEAANKALAAVRRERDLARLAADSATAMLKAAMAHGEELALDLENLRGRRCAREHKAAKTAGRPVPKYCGKCRWCLRRMLAAAHDGRFIMPARRDNGTPGRRLTLRSDNADG